jgi:hypothetical protein
MPSSCCASSPPPVTTLRLLRSLPWLLPAAAPRRPDPESHPFGRHRRRLTGVARPVRAQSGGERCAPTVTGGQDGRSDEGVPTPCSTARVGTELSRW